MYKARGKRQEAIVQAMQVLPFAFCPLPFAFSTCLVPTACFLVFASLSFAQEPKPYAAIDHDAVSYNGPGRDTGHDLVGSEIRLGLLAPLAGPRQAEGEALRGAAQMAVEEENATALPGGRRMVLVTQDETGPWGQVSPQIVHLVFDDQAVALITSADGDTAHLAEQVGNKVGVPILTLASDPTTTEINLPWIFRLGPTDTMQAEAFAREICQGRKLERVALLAQNDHDGRVGGDEFERAARAMRTTAPKRMTVESENSNRDALADELSGAQAVVIWSDAATARGLLARVREALPAAPVYLCRKAAQGDWSAFRRPRCRTCKASDGGIWTTQAAGSKSAASEAFTDRYRQRFGAEPGMGAAEAYDAVRVLAASIRQSGANRARLRDALAGVSAYAGASGVISFDHAGNDLTPTTLLRVE